MRAWPSLTVAALLAIAPAMASQQSHGFAFEDVLTPSEGTLLPLRALREVMRRHRPWQVVALYARSGAQHQEELMQGLQPFVIDIVWLQQQSEEQVSGWWQDAFAQSARDDAQHALMEPRMRRVQRIYAAGVGHGMRTRISYQPDAGLRIRHNGETPVAVVGLDMAKLMIGMWPELISPLGPGSD